MNKSGIYKILNTINGKFYIGSAVNLGNRFHTHRHKLEKNNHKNKHLQSAFNKYGANAFEFHVLEYCEKDKLLEREQYWIDETKCCDRRVGYNLNPTAGNMLGYNHTDEVKQKLSILYTGRKLSEETKAKMKGRKPSDEARAKMSAFQRNKVVSEETKMRMSLAQKGKRKSEDHKRKLSESLKGKPKIKSILIRSVAQSG